MEAVPVEHLDETVVRKMLSEHTAKFQAAKDDYEKATAQIGIDVSTAMVSAIETMGAVMESKSEEESITTAAHDKSSKDLMRT